MMSIMGQLASDFRGRSASFPSLLRMIHTCSPSVTDENLKRSEKE